MARFEQDWDSGQYKKSVVRDARCGWKQLNVQGSPTFVLPGGRQVYSPALAGFDFDEETLRVRSYTPPVRDPLDIFRDLLEEAALQE
jgi:predicted DsbA family dithiol-disulfide isomerase